MNHGGKFYMHKDIKHKNITRQLNKEKNFNTILESEKPLSKSMIWKLQADFYENIGPDAWIKGIVPQYITTNPYMANVYAKIAFAYCRDITACENYNPNTTIYLIELAAGVGRFTYTFLKNFLYRIEHSSLKDLKFKYIVTDFAERNIDYWMNHSYLKPFFESGVLDCATFDMCKDEELTLRYRGITLKKEAQKNPLILFANYTFDTLPQDTFYVTNHQLYEGLITLTTQESSKNKKDDSILANIDYSYTNKLIDGSSYYPEENINNILTYYQTQLEDTSFSIPIDSIRCINRLINIFGDDMVLLTSDKGYRTLLSMDKIYHPYLSKHGSISLTVNFHGMELYFNSFSGVGLHSPFDHENVTTSLFLQTNRSHEFIETKMAYYDMINSIGPDEFYTIKKAVLPHHTSFTTKELLTFLRYTNWDSRTFLEFYNTILSRIASEENFPKDDLVNAIHHIWENYYPIGEEGNLAYCFGSILAFFGYDEEAIEFFHSSIEFYGEDAAIYYEIALCYFNMQVLQLALEYAKKSLQFDPNYEESLNLKFMIESYSDSIF